MSDQAGDHVHWADDGRGQREVILDGQRIECVTYCDTKAGIAVVADMPLRSSDGEHIDYRPVWGDVKVVFCGGYVGNGSRDRVGEHGSATTTDC